MKTIHRAPVLGWAITALFFLILCGSALHAFPWLPRAPQATGGQPKSGQPEVPDLFAGKVFVSEAFVQDQGFQFWMFNPGNTVKKGWVPLRYSLAIFNFVSGTPDQYQAMGRDPGTTFSYELDGSSKTITFRETDGQVKAYKFEFSNSNCVTLSQIDKQFTIYSVPTKPEIFFQSKEFSPNPDTMEPDSDEHANHRLGMLNSFIEAAKTGNAPANPVVPKTKPLAPNPPAGLTAIKATLSGQYKGSFFNEFNKTTRKFDLKIGSVSDPSGQPPTTPILATLRFDDGRGDDGLQGVATYGQKTTFTLGWKNSTGSMTFDGELEGDKLSGTWRLEGANEETGRGTFEASKSKF